LSRNRFVDIVNPERLDPEFGALGLMDMSWSRAETYDAHWSTFACPKKYKFKYCDHAEDGWTIHLATGSIAHDTMEWVIKNKVDDEVEVVGKFLEAQAKHDPKNVMTDDEVSLAREITINTFKTMNDIVPNMRDIVEVERGFRYIIGRGMFLGFIDLIFWDSDENGQFIHVLDYKTSGMDKKTGKPKKKTKDHGQLALYTLAAKSMFPEARVKASLYWMKCEIPELKIDTHEFTDEQLEDFECYMKKTVEDIIEDEGFQPTKKGFVCQYCSFATDDLCKFGAGMAKRMYGWQKKRKAS
jgi:CRISPR/Cas system-associated exonuclease Cas4 (RecB family)